MKLFHTQRGYTLLFSVITAALVLGVAVFILSISRKQFILASTARDSMNALYAADSGIECMALVIDALDITTNPVSPTSFSCNGKVVNIPTAAIMSTNPSEFKSGTPVYQTPPEGSTAKMAVYLKRDDGTTPYGCFLVTIQQGTGQNNSPLTLIKSQGYNLCSDPNPSVDGDEGPDTTSTRTVERALQIRRRG